MNNIIIDYDSTFIKVESLDVLARLSKNNNNKVNNRIKEITNLGMEGKISFSESLQERIKLINSDKDDIEKTVLFLKKNISESFIRNISFIKKNHNKIFIVSNGFHELIDPIVKEYGILSQNIYANKFIFKNDKIIGFDNESPLSMSKGKVNILKKLKLKGDTHVIGDGFTDFEIKKEGYAKYFYLFTENIKRDSIIKSADYLLKSLDEFIKIYK
jgi:D-3-phosphoglycerate dehydrogenase